MIPGPTLVMKAPGCQLPVKIETLLSGNTFGATHWSDGKCEAMMLPDEPWLRRSPVEGVLFWSDECEEIARIVNGQTDGPAWAHVMPAVEPTEADYFNALTSGIASTGAKLNYVRMRLWWAGNDQARRMGARVWSAAHEENLAAFAALLSEEDVSSRLLKAEAMRELGKFDEALRLLGGEIPDNMAKSAARLRSLCEARDRWVFILHGPHQGGE